MIEIFNTERKKFLYINIKKLKKVCNRVTESRETAPHLAFFGYTFGYTLKKLCNRDEKKWRKARHNAVSALKKVCNRNKKCRKARRNAVSALKKVCNREP